MNNPINTFYIVAILLIFNLLRSIILIMTGRLVLGVVILLLIGNNRE